MTNKLPLWIKEIVENDVNREQFHFINAGHFAFINKKSSKISFDEVVPNSENKIKVAFFRDGPFLPVSTGAVTSILGMMEALVNKNVEVYLIYCYRGWSDYSLYKHQKFTTVFINPDDFYTNKKVITRVLNGLNIQICHFDSAEAICIQKKLLPKHCKTVFEVHNVENELIKQFGATIGEVNWIKNKEIRALKLSDTVIVRSLENYNSVINLGCQREKLFIYRGGISVDNIKYHHREFLDKNNILFFGHLNYEPNRQAVEIIAKTISSKLDRNIIIAGKGSPELKRKYSKNNVHFLGWIEDPNKLFFETDIAIAPLITGSGTRLKILDYMAAGIPVIGTNLSIEGLEEEIKNNMIVEDDFKKYGQIIENLYSHPQIVNKLSKGGRTFVKKYRDWKTCIGDVITAYLYALNQSNKNVKS